VGILLLVNPTYPRLVLGSVNYGASGGRYSSERLATILEWEAKNIDYLIGGADPTSYSSDVIWTTYTTQSVYWWQDDYKTWKDICESHGYVWENAILHFKEDYTAVYPWTGLDKFGAFEARNSDAGKNGVLSYSDSAFTDYTDDAYDGGSFSFNDYLYLGYELPFDKATFVFSVAGDTVAGEWQYWNGSTWTTLAVTDGTSTFASDGTVSFTPPSNWARTSVNSSWSKYFIRYNITGGTPPTITTVKGDDWLSSVGTHNCRGWDWTDENIINSGELQYNPTPPENATARFRHQGRVTGTWASGQVMLNPGYEAGGVNVSSRVIVDSLGISESDEKGVMIDVLGFRLNLTNITDPTGDSLEFDYTDVVDYSSDDWITVSQNACEAFVDYCHAIDANYKVGGNSRSKFYVSTGLDWQLSEYSRATWDNAAVEWADVHATVLRYDSMLPANNPNGAIGIFMLQDVSDHTWRGNAFWERGDRGPMIALATHYIAANDYTALSYFSYGAYTYVETDEILVWEDTSTTTTAAITADTSSDPKTIYVADTEFLPAASAIDVIKIGRNVINKITIVNSTEISTTSPLYYSEDNGVDVEWVSGEADDRLHMSDYEGGGYPSYSGIYRYANFFPAMFVDIGSPDSSGWNNGERGEWQSGVWRRDYTGAVCLHRSITFVDQGDKANFESAEEYELGGNYKRLHSDGTYGDTISSVSLRKCESAILVPA
jgi:hypothetical protein